MIMPERSCCAIVAMVCMLTATASFGQATYEWRRASVTGVMNADSCWLYLYTSNTLSPVYIDDMSMVQSSVPESGANCIVNSGFDNGTNGWEVTGSSAASTIIAEPKRSGTAALRLVSSPLATSGGGGNSVKQAVAGLSSGQVHTLSFWYYATNDVTFVARYSAHSNMAVTVEFTGAAGDGLSPLAFDYSGMRLIDAVDCATDVTHDFTQNVASAVQTILGEPCRTFTDPGTGMKFFAYRLGKSRGLLGASNYVLRVVYPQDAPRAMFILNRGCETGRGLRTGRTTGDGMKAPYINNNSESLEIPLSGRYESHETFFRLQERFPGIMQPRYNNDWPRDQLPADGFWVIFLQLSQENDPPSAGVAVRRIELYEAPPLDEIVQHVPDLPAGLPRRHLFWREEMADGLIGSTVSTERGFADDMTWYEGKFELMQFLGMRTFSKDLLEFGHNQGWDSTKYGGNDWFYQTQYPTRWTRLVRRCGELGLAVLPYYEYKGSRGYSGLGVQRRCRPVYPDTNGDYTHIYWSEDANADVTDPDTVEDLRRVLEVTVTDEKDRADFAGIWLRTRVTDFPVSFSDRCLELFRAETGRPGAVTRNMLFFQDAQYDAALYAAYREWWYGKRKDFLDEIRDYVRSAVKPSMELLFTADHTEAGKSLVWPNQADCVAENVAAWTNALTVRSLADAIPGHWQWDALTADVGTYGTWEWHHSIPPPDPQRYTGDPGIMMTHTLNRAYTAERNTLEGFRAMDGLACIRHYSLNEHVTTLADDPAGVGYFVSDVDYAGPFVVLPEALAVANGDPTFLGYLASHHFNRGDPYYVRRFNANYLALPAMAGTVASNMSLDANLVVRQIDTPRNGIYLAAVNIGRARKAMTIHLPEAGRLVDAVTGTVLGDGLSSYSMNMDPCELRSLRYFRASVNTPPEILAKSSLSVEWFNTLTTHSQWQTIDLTADAVDYDAGNQPLSSLWSLKSGDADKVLIQSPSSLVTRVAFLSPGVYVLTLTVSDGVDSSSQDVTVTVSLQTRRIAVTPDMVSSLSPCLVDAGLFNQQSEVADPPINTNLGEQWQFDGTQPQTLPWETLVDLQQAFHITQVWLYDDVNIGQFNVYAGGGPAGAWTQIVSYATSNYIHWQSFPVDVTTRYVKFSRMDGAGIVGEALLHGLGGGLEWNTNVAIQPVVMEMSRAAAGALSMSVNANPLRAYALEESTNLCNVGWQTVHVWSVAEPFPHVTVPCDKAGAFYRVKESSP